MKVCDFAVAEQITISSTKIKRIYKSTNSRLIKSQNIFKKENCYSASRSTEMVHSPISAANAPTAASIGANNAPTTPNVKGKDINSFPDLS